MSYIQSIPTESELNSYFVGDIVEIALSLGFSRHDIMNAMNINTAKFNGIRKSKTEHERQSAERMISSGSKRSLVRLLTLVTQLNAEAGIKDPISWLETPFTTTVGYYTPLHLFFAQRLDILFDLAMGTDAVEITQRLVRDGLIHESEAKWEVFEDTDGYRSIRAKSPQNS